MQEPHEILQQIEELDSIEPYIMVMFEPFSYIIASEIKKLKNRIERNRLYESILNDVRTSVINETDSAKTTLYPNHSTHDKCWNDTVQMAIDLNSHKVNVCFLPEIGDSTKNVKRADAIIKHNKTWYIADFKYFSSTNSNTLGSDLINGFRQADIIVLKVANADLGVLREAIGYIQRMKISITPMLIINKYGKVKMLSKADFTTGKYLTSLKGFLQ